MRQTALEIDLGHLKSNFKKLSARADNARLLAMLKSDAYGHSMKEVLLALESIPGTKLNGFGVANVEEGIEARRAGAIRPIYVLSGIQFYDGDLHRCLKTVNLIPVIGSLRVLKQLASTLKSLKAEQAVHLKLNTGMNRLGIDPGELDACLRILSSNKNIRVDGILSHFSAGEKKTSSITKSQVASFREVMSLFKARGIEPKFMHMANSSGLSSGVFPEGNLARVGLHLYGLDDQELKPVASWTAQVYHIRDIGKGSAVGYGPHFRARRKMKMAVLGVGYGDGYRRALSNRAEVLIRGRRCPVIGAISMDLTTIDVSALPSVTVNDRVTLIGKDGGEQITAGELASHAGTISYEILTGISARVPRIFLNG